MVYIHSEELLSDKRWKFSFCYYLYGIEGIVLSEVSQKVKHQMISLLWTMKEQGKGIDNGQRKQNLRFCWKKWVCRKGKTCPWRNLRSLDTLVLSVVLMYANLNWISQQKLFRWHWVLYCTVCIQCVHEFWTKHTEPGSNNLYLPLPPASSRGR